MSDNKGLIEDKKFWEYAIEIKIMGYDPVDILKEWLKKNNPEYLEDDSHETTEGNNNERSSMAV